MLPWTTSRPRLNVKDRISILVTDLDGSVLHSPRLGFGHASLRFKPVRLNADGVRDMTDHPGLDVLVGLLFAEGATERRGEPIRGITRLEKLVFLTLEEGGFSKAKADYSYKPYELGPYSKEVVDYIEALKQAKLVKSEIEDFESHRDVLDAVAATRSIEGAGTPGKVEVYALTDKGLQIGEKLFGTMSPAQRKALTDIKRRFNQIPLAELLKYVYTNYRQMTSKSKILDDVLGVGSRPDLQRAT